MRRALILACGLILTALSAHAEGDLSRLFGPRGTVVSNKVAADYVAAMSVGEQGDPTKGMPLGGMRTRWLWIAGDGSTVQVVAENTYRVRKGGNCLDAFCETIDCFGAVWPDIVCAYGGQRKLSAPNLATVVLDGVTYKRDLR